MRKLLFTALASVLLLSVVAFNSSLMIDDTAYYDVQFNSTWSSTTHPHPSFPASAHMSPSIGVTHAPTESFWTVGGTASPGIEQMAETGGTSLIRADFQAAIDAGKGNEIFDGIFLFSPGVDTIMSVEATTVNPVLTWVTMIAPSPDWFTGVANIELIDAGDWITSTTVTLYPYDSGTDSGTAYNSGNADVTPHLPIEDLTGDAPFSFAPVGTLTLTRTFPTAVGLDAQSTNTTAMPITIVITVLAIVAALALTAVFIKRQDA